MMMNSKNHKAFVDQHVPRESKTGDDGWTEHRHVFFNETHVLVRRPI